MCHSSPHMLICGGPEEGGAGQWCIQGGSLCVYVLGRGEAPLDSSLESFFFFFWFVSQSPVVYLRGARLWMLYGARLSTLNCCQQMQMRRDSDGMYMSERWRAMWVGCRHVCATVLFSNLGRSNLRSRSWLKEKRQSGAFDHLWYASDATGTCDLHPFKETFFRRSNALRKGGRSTRKTVELVAVARTLSCRGNKGASQSGC